MGFIMSFQLVYFLVISHDFVLVFLGQFVRSKTHLVDETTFGILEVYIDIAQQDCELGVTVSTIWRKDSGLILLTLLMFR